MAQPPSPSPPPPAASDNAFAPDFLADLRRRDEPVGAAEAELVGPWRIDPTPEGFALFRRWESAERGDAPFARFRRREDALLFFAVLPGAGRDPMYRLRPEATPAGYGVDSAGEVSGGLQDFEPEVVSAAAVAAAVVRSPLSLAALLEAAGPLVLEKAGELLGRRNLARLIGA